jgi:hypothetical protein
MSEEIIKSSKNRMRRMLERNRDKILIIFSLKLYLKKPCREQEYKNYFEECICGYLIALVRLS